MSSHDRRAEVWVDQDGVVIAEPAPTRTLDVLFDDRRIWSFDPVRDSTAMDGRQRVTWPRALHGYLEGLARIQVREHVGDQVYFDDEVRFGVGLDRVNIADQSGNLLTLNKSGNLVQAFSQRSIGARDHLLSQVRRVLDLLSEAGGVRSYLCYGLLLGAVREGRVLGHDDDGDVSYLSNAEHPADVILESYELERMFHRNGWSTRRITGGCFKVASAGPGGEVIGIDVFASFYVGDTYYLTDFVQGRLSRSDVVPIGTVSIDGHELPAPARPESLLALTYGPSWHIPDPAFKFSPPPSTQRRMVGWLRYAENRMWWRGRYGSDDARDRGDDPSDFARWTSERLSGSAALVEIGCGRGRDAVWLSEQGHDVLGLDYAPSAIAAANRHRTARDATAEFRALNIYEARQTLVTGAELVRRTRRPDVVYARWLLDSITEEGRHNVWTFASMILRGNGSRLYTEVRLAGGVRARRGSEFAGQWQARLSVAQLRDEISRHGGTVEVCEELPAAEEGGFPVPPRCRLVVRWER